MGNDEERIKFASIVASVFHNAAVEYEYAKDYSNSLIYYQKALRVSQIHLGKFDPTTQRLLENFNQAKA